MSAADANTSRNREGANGGAESDDNSRSLTVAARSEIDATTKPTMLERGRAYLEVARLSNASTIISNVLTGVAIGLASDPQAGADLNRIGYLCFGMLLMYVGGMALNDWADAAFDREHNPQRPVPSGRMSRTAALVFAIGSFTEGLICTGMASIRALVPAGILIVLIVAYDVLHKKHPASVILMGLCRGMVYVVAAVAMTNTPDWSIAAPLAVGLALYITLLTVIARGEHAAESRRPVWSGVALAVVALAPLLLIDAAEPMWVVSAAALLFMWVVLAGLLLGRQPPQVRSTVLRWLAGICLVDIVYLAALQQPLFVAVAFGCFLLTLLAHRRIPGT